MAKGRELLSDSSSYEENLINGVDPRIKFFFCLVFLGVIISTKNTHIPAVILACMAAGLISLRVSWRLFLVRGLPALIIALTILATQVFLFGKTPLFSLDVAGIKVYGYREGLDRGLAMMFRVLAGISTVLFLSMSTSFNKLIYAAGWFRLPGAFLEVLTITYRYIHVLVEETAAVKSAQKMRLGYSSLGKSVISLGNLSGITIIKTIDKSERLYKAMKSRGYQGQRIVTQYNARFVKSDWIVTACLLLATGAMLAYSF